MTCMALSRHAITRQGIESSRRNEFEQTTALVLTHMKNIQVTFSFYILSSENLLLLHTTLYASENILLAN